MTCICPGLKQLLDNRSSAVDSMLKPAMRLLTVPVDRDIGRLVVRGHLGFGTACFCAGEVITALRLSPSQDGIDEFAHLPDPILVMPARARRRAAEDESRCEADMTDNGISRRW